MLEANKLNVHSMNIQFQIASFMAKVVQYWKKAIIFHHIFIVIRTERYLLNVQEIAFQWEKQHKHHQIQ